MGTVVHTTNDQRLIRVSVDKGYNNFLANTGDVQCAPLGAGPGSGNPYPARAFFIFGTIAVPMKLQFDASVFIGIDLITGLADDDCFLKDVKSKVFDEVSWTQSDGRRESGKLI